MTKIVDWSDFANKVDAAKNAGGGGAGCDKEAGELNAKALELWQQADAKMKALKRRYEAGEIAFNEADIEADWIVAGLRQALADTIAGHIIRKSVIEPLGNWLFSQGVFPESFKDPGSLPPKTP